MNLATILTGSASKAPQQSAVSLGERTLTYEDLDRASCRVAGLLVENIRMAVVCQQALGRLRRP